MKSYDIALIPPRHVASRAIVMSGALRRRGGEFVLNDTTERPHVSIYMTALPAGSLRAVRDRLARIAHHTCSVELRARAYHKSEGGWVDVEYHRTRSLMTLQGEIIALVNPIRNGILRERDRARLATASALYQRNIHRFGYRFVGTAFRPHLTLTKLGRPRVSVRIRDRVDDFSCTASMLGLFTLGAHGTCVRLIATFPLASSSIVQVAQ